MRRTLRHFYLKLVRQRDAPAYTALGVALGVFVGLAVPPGVHMLTALALAWLLRGNRTMAVLATWIANPLSMPFIYPLQVMLGCFVMGIHMRKIVPHESVWSFLTDPRAQGQVVLAVLTGGMLTGAVGAAMSYVATKFVVKAYRSKEELRRVRRAMAGAAKAASNPSARSDPAA